MAIVGLLAACSDGTGWPDAGDARFPLPVWTVTQEFGTWNPAWGGYHLAEDVAATPGDAVAAPVAGVVRAAYFGADISGYGGLVLVEHTVGGATFVTLYGHVSTRRGTPVSVGEAVTAGQVLAYIADDDEDGGPWGPHLHFGIRSGGYDETATLCGEWLFVGYTRECPGVTHEDQRDFWYDPTDVLRDLGAALPVGVGGAGPRP